MTEELTEKEKAREAWITRFEGLFGEPHNLPCYRRGECDFEELHRAAISMAENMVAEASYCPAVAFD